ncbi:MAG TPA: hypothetical protein VHP99_16270, partial [Pyrinomonadaceae bacterium]|nr:hypothetical protein [Pyrinomonadaceae bacterium]
MKRKLNPLLPLIALATMVLTTPAQTRVPSLDDLLTLKTVGGSQISPDGKRIAYAVTHADFKQDAFVSQIWLVDAASGKSYQLTRGDKSSTNPRWS